MTARIFDGASRIEAWPDDARTIAYGDGVFETMHVHRGVVPWWDAHWNRLTLGAQRLRLSLPSQTQARREAAALFADNAHGVLKLVLGRGGAGRGYAPSPDAAAMWMLSRSALPAAHVASGLRVHWCQTRLSIQPALAGIKHCNRLEQVLARAECVDAGADEGLMLDDHDSVISATAANLFVLRDARWVTPVLDRCGVAGVCRSHLMPLLDATQMRLSIADVESADAVFLCNAVRGILPVVRLGARAWPSRAVDGARRQLARIHSGFAIGVTP